MTIESYIAIYRSQFKARLSKALKDVRFREYEDEKALVSRSLERLEALYSEPKLCQILECTKYQFNSWKAKTSLPNYKTRATISLLIRGKYERIDS